jgi:hypothetical protein
MSHVKFSSELVSVLGEHVVKYWNLAEPGVASTLDSLLKDVGPSECLVEVYALRLENMDSPHVCSRCRELRDHPLNACRYCGHSDGFTFNVGLSITGESHKNVWLETTLKDGEYTCIIK